MDKRNDFAHCKNNLEVITKTAIKGRDVDVLFCIMDEDVFVFQTFKMMPVSLEQFAAGLDIDLNTAQVIVHQKVETIKEAEDLISASLREFEDEAREVKEEAIAFVKELISPEVRILQLTGELTVLKGVLTRYKEKYGDLIEEFTEPEEVKEEVKEEAVEE